MARRIIQTPNTQLLRGYSEESDPTIEWGTELPSWIHKAVNDYNVKQQELGTGRSIQTAPTNDLYDTPVTGFNFYERNRMRPEHFEGYFDPHSGNFGVSRNQTSNIRFFSASIGGLGAQASGNTDVHYRTRQDNLSRFLDDPTGYFDNPENEGGSFAFSRHELSGPYLASMSHATYMTGDNLSHEARMGLLSELRAKTGFEDWVSRDNLAYRATSMHGDLEEDYQRGVSGKDWQRNRRGNSLMFTQDFQQRTVQQASFFFEGQTPVSGTRTRGLYVDNPSLFPEGQSVALANSGWVGRRTDFMIPDSKDASFEQINARGFTLGASVGAQRPDNLPPVFHFTQSQEVQGMLGDAYNVGKNALAAITGLVRTPQGMMAQVLAFNPWHTAENKPNPGTKGQNQGRSYGDPLLTEAEKTLGDTPDFLLASPSKPGRILDLGMRGLMAEPASTVMGQYLTAAQLLGISRDEALQHVTVAKGGQYNMASGALVGLDEGAQIQFANTPQAHDIMNRAAFRFFEHSAVSYGEDTAYSLNILNNPRPITASGKTLFNINRLAQMAETQPAIFSDLLAQDREGRMPNAAREVTRAYLANSYGVNTEARAISAQELSFYYGSSLPDTTTGTGAYLPSYSKMFERMAERTGDQSLSIGGVVLPNAHIMSNMLSRTEYGDDEKDYKQKALGTHVARLIEELVSQREPTAQTAALVIHHLMDYATQNAGEARGLTARALTGTTSGNAYLPADYATAHDDDVRSLIRNMTDDKKQQRAFFRRFKSGEGMVFAFGAQESQGHNSTVPLKVISIDRAASLFPGSENILPAPGGFTLSPSLVDEADKDFDADRNSATATRLLVSQVNWNSHYTGSSLGMTENKPRGGTQAKLDKGYTGFMEDYAQPMQGIVGKYGDTSYAKEQMSRLWSPFIESVTPLMSQINDQIGLEDKGEFAKHLWSWGKEPYQQAMDIKPSQSKATEWMREFYQNYAIGSTILSPKRMSGFLGKDEPDSDYRSTMGGDYATLALRTFDRAVHMQWGSAGDGTKDSDALYLGKGTYEGYASHAAFALGQMGKVASDPEYVKRVQASLSALYSSRKGVDAGLTQDPDGLVDVLSAITEKQYTPEHKEAFKMLVKRQLVEGQSLLSVKKGDNPIIDDMIQLQLGEGADQDLGKLDTMSFAGAYTLMAGGSNALQRSHGQIPVLAPAPKSGYGSTFMDFFTVIGDEVRTGTAYRKGKGVIEKALDSLVGSAQSPALRHSMKRLVEPSEPGQDIPEKVEGLTEGHPDDVAGVVHGGEYVVSADDVKLARGGLAQGVVAKMMKAIGAPMSENDGYLPQYRQGGYVRFHGYKPGGYVYQNDEGGDSDWRDYSPSADEYAEYYGSSSAGIASIGSASRAATKAALAAVFGGPPVVIPGLTRIPVTPTAIPVTPTAPATPAAVALAAAHGVPLSAVTPSAAGKITVPGVKAAIKAGAGVAAPPAGGMGGGAIPPVAPIPPAAGSSAGSISGYITQDNKGDVKWTQGADLTPDEIAGLLDRQTGMVASGRGQAGAEILDKSARSPLGMAVRKLQDFASMTSEERTNLPSETVAQYQRLIGATHTAESAYNAAVKGDQTLSVDKIIRKRMDDIGYVNQRAEDLGYSGTSRAQYETEIRNKREGRATKAGSYEIGDADVTRMPAMDNFIRTMRDVNDVVGQVNQKHEIYVKQAREMLGVFDRQSEMISKADKSYSAAGGDMNLLRATNPNAAKVLDMAGDIHDPDSLRAKMSNQWGAMGSLRSALAAHDVGNAADLWGGNDDARQEYLTKTLLRTGRVGALRREQMPEDAFTGGLDTGFGTVQGEGNIRALGTAARYTGKMLSSLRAISYINNDFVRPINAEIGNYQNVLESRQQALAAQGGISAQDLMGSAYGVNMQRQGIQRNIAYDAGQQLSSVYGGLAGAFPGLGRTEGTLQGIVAPAAGAAIAAGQIFQNEFAGPIAGGLVLGGAAIVNTLATASSLDSSAGAYANFRAANRAGGLGGVLLSAVTNPTDLLAIAAQRIGNPALADKASSLGSTIDLFGQYYGAAPSDNNESEAAGNIRQWRALGTDAATAAVGRQNPNLTQAQLRSAGYTAWMAQSGAQYGLSEQAGTSLYSWNQRYNPSFGPDQAFFQQQIRGAQVGADYGSMGLSATLAMGYSAGNDAMVTQMTQSIAGRLDAMPASRRPAAQSVIEQQIQQIAPINAARSAAGMSPFDPSNLGSTLTALLADPRHAGILLSGLQTEASVAQGNLGFTQQRRSPNAAMTFDASYKDDLQHLLTTNQTGAALALQSGYQMAGQLDYTLQNYDTPNRAQIGRAFINMSQPQQQMAGAALSGDPYAMTRLLGAKNPIYNQMDMNTGYRAMTFSVDATQYSQVAATASMFGQSAYLMSPQQLAGGTASLQGQLVANQFQSQQYSFQQQQNQAQMGLAFMTGGASGVNGQGYANGGSLAPLQALLQQYNQPFNPGNGMGQWQIQDAQTGISRAQTTFGLMQQGQQLAISQQQLQVGTAHQLTEMNISHEHTQEQLGWSMENLQFSRNVMDVQEGWQMQDYTRNIRYARGREKRDLMREQQRATISYAMQSNQNDVEQGRVTTQSQWEDQRFQREKTYFDQSKQWQEQLLALQQQAHQKAMEWTQQQFALEDQGRLIERQYTVAQQQIAIQVNQHMFTLQQTALQLNTNLSLMQETMQALTNKAQLFNATGQTAGVIAGTVASGQSLASASGYTGTVINGVALPGVTGTAAHAVIGSINTQVGHGHYAGGGTGRGSAGTPVGYVDPNEYVVPENGSLVVKEKSGSSSDRMIQLLEAQLVAAQALLQKQFSFTAVLPDGRKATAQPDSLLQRSRTRTA